ncbi:uncharacterized protein LOC8271447 isoform X2 [Ricinus communis]|uniref:uncharacterized protein LOC8271447 isoform X2 n=1 Tax=Ricinus communis TaxID=3988 RepID=UPI00201A9A2F|nr:uncharacterized protein LOC8271447 isoform X2 [Ricinus communis]
MASPKMGILVFLRLFICIAVMALGALHSAESILLIHIHGAPPKHSRFTNAAFRYSVQRPDGTDACNNVGCSISCKIDGHILRSCPANAIELKNLTANQEHNFLLNVTTHDGEKNTSSYSWFIDTVPPTATISSDQNYTDAQKVTIDVTFSEVCTGMRGFKCINSSNCDVLLDGPAYVEASSLHVIEPNIKFRLDIIVSMKSIYGRVVVRVADNFCTDKAGNSFKRSNDSIMVLHFDRRPVLVDLWMPVPSYVMEISGFPRTVLATNKMEDLKIFLDFSIPIMNSTEELLNALRVNSGNILPVFSANHGNRKFVYQLNNISKTEIITVQLDAGLVIGKTGTPVSPVGALTVLFDSTKPEVGLSTSSLNATKASNINVIVEFTKPVFGFEASMVKVEGGKLTRFRELSGALYSFTVLAITPNMVFIVIPEGKVNDISGNLNLASNQLEVKHYSTPAISMALHSFITAGVLATSLAAAALSLASANLGAIGALAPGNTNNVAPNPSMNLHGLYGHLQVFVLSDWFSANHPIEYSETTKGLRWIIPRQKLPWKKNGSPTWPNHVYLADKNFYRLPLGFPYHIRDDTSFNLDLTYSFDLQDQRPFLAVIDPNFAWLHEHNISMKSAPYGLPLNSREYFTNFLRGEPLSASNVVKRMANYKGWEDLEMNLFFLGVGGGSLFMIHILILLFLRWRIGASSAHGILSFPRFELLLLILALPCVSQASAFVMRGGTVGGIITGALLLVIPAALIFSVSIFLLIAVFPGSFAQYKEMRHVDITESWYTKLWLFFIGRPVFGKWFFGEGLPSSFLPRFGILFEDRKGPPLYVFVDQNDPSTRLKWTGSGQTGIGRMRALSSDESNEEIKTPLARRILGCVRSSYIILDLLRRVSLGIISGARSSQTSRKSHFALVITLLQFIFLFLLKPYIRRGVQVVESISLLCEVGIFGLSIASNHLNPLEARNPGYIMLALLFLTFIAQIINEWYALIKCILGLSRPKRNSFRLGLKFAAKGLVLPFLPRKHWSGVIPNSSQMKTGLSTILPPETEFVTRDATIENVEPYRAMTATVVPVLSPGSPSDLDVTLRTSSTPAEATLTEQRAGKGKTSKCERKNELKKLRELAKASFAGVSKSDEGRSASYKFKEQNFSPKTSCHPQASTSKTRD